MRTMMVHLKWNEPNAMIETLLVSLYPDMVKETSESTYLCFTVEAETLDLTFEDLYDLLVEDFQLRFTLVVIPETARALASSSMWRTITTSLKTGYYGLEPALIQAQKATPVLVEHLRERLNKILTKTDITTALALANANMNISTAAKRLYIHRNTMIYRLEHISQVTGIDVKAFKGLYILYSLYAMH